MDTFSSNLFCIYYKARYTLDSLKLNDPVKLVDSTFRTSILVTSRAVSFNSSCNSIFSVQERSYSFRLSIDSWLLSGKNSFRTNILQVTRVRVARSNTEQFAHFSLLVTMRAQVSHERTASLKFRTFEPRFPGFHIVLEKFPNFSNSCPALRG